MRAKAFAVAVLVPCLVLSVAGKKDKKKKKGKGAPPVELVGWQPVSGEGGGQCYHPPKWDGLVSGPRKLARAEAIAAIVGQWRGERDDGVQMPDRLVMNVETVLLGDPADIETIAGENLEWCRKHFAGKGQGWADWATALPTRLTAGECKGSLLPQEMHDYLSLSSGWHMNMGFCKDEKVLISASNKDYYRVQEGGPWITADGDPDQEASGDYPCTDQGCKVGQLLLRFKNYDGTIDIVQPIGTEAVFRMPDHGSIWVRINDKTPADNVWKVEGGMQHHTGVSYMAAD